MRKFEIEILNMPETKINQLHGVVLDKCPVLSKYVTDAFLQGLTNRLEFEGEWNDIIRWAELTDLSNYFFEAEIRVRVTSDIEAPWIESYNDGKFEEYDD